MQSIAQLLDKYEIDSERGFLPSQDPLDRLPRRYDAWEALAINFASYINAGVIREQIDRLEIIERPEFQSALEIERAMQLMSFFAHAYVHAPPGPCSYIPESIAKPWIYIAQKLKRKPILSHASIVLHNWRRLDKDRPIQIGNLATLCQFHGGLDESWFYLVTVEVEQVGAKGIPLMLHAMQASLQGDYDAAANYLAQANQILESLSNTLRKMYNFCDSYIFYHRVRPFLASFDSIDYRGTGLPSQSHHGGSAAQSSLLQFYDAVLGIEYEHQATSAYLRSMRHHMPFSHASFLSYIEGTSDLRNGATKSKELASEYDRAITALISFRNEHLKMVSQYIMKQAKQAQKVATGTGGTNPMIFLKSVRNQNEKAAK